MLLKRMEPTRLATTSDSSTERLAVPPMWKVRMVSWVPGSPIDWAAMMPTARPRSAPMPRDTGFSNLDAEAQRKEDLVRSGPTRCALCHGDPDGAGPLEAPAQGSLVNVPSRRGCASCHDDWDPSRSYRSNGQIMPAQLNDIGCNACHDSRFPGPLSPIEGHTHPLDDLALDTGLHLELLAIDEAGRVARRYPSPGLPATFLIGTDGVIARTVFGQLNEDQIDSLIAEAFGA